MLRKESKTVPEGNYPTPRDAYVMITREELRRVPSKSMSEAFGEFKEGLRRIDQRLASLEQDARQPRLAMEASVPADKKSRERTEGAVTAVQAKRGGSCSAKRVHPGPKSSTSFGLKAEPPALPRRDDVLVDNGAAMPKSCPSPLEMRTPRAAGGFLSTGKTSTATMTILHHMVLWFCPTEEINLRTSIQYVSYYQYSISGG